MHEETPIHDAYEAALDYLYGLINFEQRRHDRYMANKLDPSRPGRLMAHFGSPHKRFPSIHIAGTKGKGSVAAICAYCLRAAGLTVGLYTSPHVTEFRERIRILTPTDADGRISKDCFTDLLGKMPAAVDKLDGVTWFEVVTAVAFLHFAAQGVDVAVVEVGLGGRLDATNVLTPLVSVITSLSYDHTEFLGDTLYEIAGEKGGIIKPGIPVVTAPQPLEALERLKEIAQERHSPMIVVGEDWKYEGERRDGNSWKQNLVVKQTPHSSFIPKDSSFQLALAGAHQLENATVALAALSCVHDKFPSLTINAITTGLNTVAWTGRLEIVHRAAGEPTILVDCAHNADSASKLSHALADAYEYDRLWLVLGVTKGKDVASMMQVLLPLAEATVATKSSHPRAAEVADLVDLASDLGFEIIGSDSVADAVGTAWALAEDKDFICVTGSIFVVGDLLNEWEGLKSQLSRDPAVG